MLTLRTHNFLDYCLSLLLFSFPYLLGFYEVVAARNLFLTLGFVHFSYSIMTKNHLAIARLLPLGSHMIMDLGVGALLVTGPYLFDYRLYITLPQLLMHFALAVFAVSLVIFTRVKNERAKGPREARLTSGSFHGENREGVKKEKAPRRAP